MIDFITKQFSLLIFVCNFRRSFW